MQTPAIGALSVVLLACSCTTFSSLKTARSIAPGTYEITAAVDAEFVTVSSNVQDLQYGGSGTGYAQQFELAARFGVTERLDLGTKVWPAGIEINATVSLVRSRLFDLAHAI